VQSVVVDDQDNLWVLDPAAPKMQEIVEGGPKLVKIDLATNRSCRRSVSCLFFYAGANAPVNDLSSTPESAPPLVE
jgi:hypothetical protein